MSVRRLNAFSEFYFTARPALLIGILVFFSLWTNQAVIDFRMKEMARAMAALSRSYNGTSALNMLARYEMIRQRGSLPEEAETALELRLQALANSPPPKQDIHVDQGPHIQEKIITVLLRGMRFILGKKERVYDVPEATRRDLELGYFYERGRKYNQAVSIYSRALDEGHISNPNAATMRLHRGFCLSLLGDLSGARRDFQSISSLVGNTDENQVAGRMLEILKGMENELKLARLQQLGPFDQGKRLFRLGSTIEAMNLFNQVLGDTKISAMEKLDARFWFGRAQEELGQDSDAVVTYRSLIQDAPNSSSAKQANRRLYVLGKYYQNDAQLEKAALQQLQKYQDFQFIDALKSIGQVKARIATFQKPGSLGVNPSNSNLNPDSLEQVTANPSSSVGLQRVDSSQNNPGSLKAALRKIPERKQAMTRIKADPLRREAILGTIESSRGELEFLFQKWLRKGEPFEGRLTIRILIGPDGTVREAKSVSEKSTIDQSAFVADILQNVRRWRFRGDPGESQDIPVSFPLDFKSRE
jgi:tetratricopeptide (TPR) repeat protein